MQIKSMILILSLLSILLVTCRMSHIQRASIHAQQRPHKGCLGQSEQYYDFGKKQFVLTKHEELTRNFESGQSVKNVRKLTEEQFPEFAGYEIESRGIQLTTYFPKDDQDRQDDGIIQGIDVQKLIKSHKIATSYYQRVIKTRPFPSSYNQFLTFPPGFNCYGLPIPDEYYENGYNSSIIDMGIFAGIYSDNSEGVLAYTTFCGFYIRPIYHILMFNAATIAPFFQSNNFQFHQIVNINIHEIGHMLGINQDYYLGDGFLSLFVDSPNSPFRRVRSEVITRDDSISQFAMLILPKVKQYVSRVFDCQGQQLLGAPLQSFDGDFTHWNYQILQGQLLSPYISRVDSRLTKLTLLTFLESGWYTNVQFSLGWDITYNIGAGCNFLNGNFSMVADRYFCDPLGPATQCNIQGTYGGSCSNDSRITDIDGLRCQVDNPLTRCFNELSSAEAGCYEAGCYDSANAILIKYENQQKICQQGDSTVSFRNGIILKCPIDYKAFCASNACKEWCGKQGVCINGRCVPSDLSTPVAPPIPTPNCRAISRCKVCQYSRADPSLIECIKCQDRFGVVNNQCKACPRKCGDLGCVFTKQQGQRVGSFKCL